VGDMKKMQKKMSEGYRRFLKELDTSMYIDWCIRSSPDPKEVVECFQEILPICKFDEDCKEKIEDYLDDHDMDIDMDTGVIEYEDESVHVKSNKHILEQYLEKIQEGWWPTIPPKPKEEKPTYVSIHSFKVEMKSHLDEKQTTHIVKLINQNYSNIMNECRKFYKVTMKNRMEELIEDSPSEQEFISGLTPILLYIYNVGFGVELRFKDKADFTWHDVVIRLNEKTMKVTDIYTEG
jgi:hypothetical protein